MNLGTGLTIRPDRVVVSGKALELGVFPGASACSSEAVVRRRCEAGFAGLCFRPTPFDVLMALLLRPLPFAPSLGDH